MSYETMLREKYPAKAHARRVAARLRETTTSSASPSAVDSAILYVEGRATRLLEDNDEPEPFRQRRTFFYLTGCPLPDCRYTYDVAADRATLYIPPVDPDSVIWSGLPVSADEALAAWDVDEVRFVDGLNADLAAAAAPDAPARRGTVFALAGQVSPDVSFVQFDTADLTALQPVVDECRVVKDAYEIALMRKANAISTVAHHAVLDAIARGAAADEAQLEAVFLQQCVARKAKNQAYHTIVAGGRGGATLHYVRNDQPLEGRLNLLLDGGCEWDCYASDITRGFPLTKKYTPESRAIYDLVLSMQTQCLAAIRAGVRWEDMHVLAHRVLIAGLLRIGILRGGTVDEILAARTSVAFMPHGLGHYLGMDTHDTGGRPDYEDKDALFRYLRIRGDVPAGSVVTVEPGIYFCKFIINPYLKDDKHAKYIDASVLDRFWDVGGFRIEDDVVVTTDGIDNLTTTIKDPDEIERIIAQGGNINLICSNVSNPASPFINPCAEQAVQFVLLPPNDPGYAQFNHPWSHDDKAGPCRQQQSIHPVARQAFPLSIHG
jgi:Xaa-Pro dipeptidase